MEGFKLSRHGRKVRVAPILDKKRHPNQLGRNLGSNGSRMQTVLCADQPKHNFSLDSCSFVMAATHTIRANDTYMIDCARSRIDFLVHQFFGSTKGRFAQFAGTIMIDQEHPEHSSVEAKIQVQTIDTGIKKRDEHLLSPEFFDARKYPLIMFKSHGVKQSSAQAGDIVGDLTIHGVTNPVILHVRSITPLAEIDTARKTRWSVVVESIRRRDFGLMFNGTVEAISGISQEVAVEMTIEAIKTRWRNTLSC